MLSDPSSVLEQLHMADAKLTSLAIIYLFTALATGNKLKELYVTIAISLLMKPQALLLPLLKRTLL